MKILIVIPCYNEEEVLPKTLDVLGALIRKKAGQFQSF
jgi:polyisoprenyl-phosphate glycosyltransferase